MEFELLEDYINNNEIDKAISYINDFGAKKNKEAIPLLIKYLQNTDSNMLRNEIALALSDIGCEEAVVPLIEMIKNPKTIGNRGTLLYALQALNYSAHIEFIVDLLYDDSFEVSRQALILIEAISGTLPLKIKEKCIESVNNNIGYLQEKMDFLLEALDSLK